MMVCSESVFLFFKKEIFVQPYRLKEGFLLAANLINAGVLEVVDDARLKEIAPKGSVFISCGDRDRFHAYFRKMQSVVPMHPITLNGGGILLGTGVDETRRVVITEDTRDAFDLKGIGTVVLSSHFPCGKAGLLDFGLREILLKTLEGKAFLKKTFPTCRVLPLMSIDWRPVNGEVDDTFIETFTFHLHDLEHIRDFVV